MNKEKYFTEDSLNAHYLFKRIGWKENSKYDYDPYVCYSITYEYNDDIDVLAVTAVDKDGMDESGDIGIAWLEVCRDPDCGGCLMYSDIDDLISAYETAQEVLVDTGIPFSSDYTFKGNDSDELRQRNDALRKRIGLDEFERSLRKKEKE